MTMISASTASAPYRSYTAKELSDGIPIAQLTTLPVDLSKVKPVSPEIAKPISLLDGPTFDFLTSLPPGTASDDPSKIWGNIEVGGKVVAQIFTSGVITGKAGFELPQIGQDTADPAARARAMIEAYGGQIVSNSQTKKLELFMG